jgi:hypothetical protein
VGERGGHGAESGGWLSRCGKGGMAWWKLKLVEHVEKDIWLSFWCGGLSNEHVITGQSKYNDN